MKKKLIRMLSLVLCFCALLSFAACGEETPAKADDITPPANDTPTADEPEEPSADEPTKPDVPVEPSEPETPTEPEKPTEPDAPTEPTQPTEPDVPSEPDEPSEPVQPTEPEKWSSPEAQAILSQYERVLRGEETVYNTTTKKDEYFDDPGNNPDTVLKRADITIVDFDQNGLPEVLVLFGLNDNFSLLYSIDGVVYTHNMGGVRSVQVIYKDHIVESSGGMGTSYYHTYTPISKGVMTKKIAYNTIVGWDSTIQQPLRYYELDGVEVSEAEYYEFLKNLGVGICPYA